jgi:hypothetical protein
MECPEPDNGYAYGVNCQAVFVRDQDILRDGVYVISYYFNDNDGLFLDDKSERNKLTTFIVSIKHGYIFNTKTQTLNRGRFSARHTDEEQQAHIHCASSFAEAIEGAEYPTVLVGMLPLYPEGGIDSMNKSCIEFHMAYNVHGIRRFAPTGQMSCAAHDMYPFCECGYAVGLRAPSNIRTFEIYMHLSATSPLKQCHSYIKWYHKFEEFVDVYDDLLNDVFRSYKHKYYYSVPRALLTCVPTCSCSTMLADEYEFFRWDSLVMSRVI